jgi:hypothetical protein
MEIFAITKQNHMQGRVNDVAYGARRGPHAGDQTAAPGIKVAGVKKLPHDDRGSDHDNAVSKTQSPSLGQACRRDGKNHELEHPTQGR